MADTLLVISGVGVAPYSARGLSQTLTPIPAKTVQRRTVNGVLKDLSPATGFAKYVSTITCQDVQAPALDGVWPGRILTVDCVHELSYLTSGGTPGRTVVSGSSHVIGTHTFYRPRITFMVTGFQMNVDEWGHTINWTLNLEEV